MSFTVAEHLEQVGVHRDGGNVIALQALKFCPVVVGLQEEVTITDCAAPEEKHHYARIKPLLRSFNIHILGRFECACASVTAVLSVPIVWAATVRDRRSV